ncbi:MAG TPA: hypothetical protein VNG73_06945 [Gemmatimonadaceae bacterium]|nr:hypothetical protein [Gemmatimonadaceae bacterium]
MKISVQASKFRHSIPRAWKQVPLLYPAKIAGSITVSALNVLWQGHGVLRSSSTPLRLFAVAIACYVVATIAEFLWLIYHGPRFTGFESPTASKGVTRQPATDPLVEQLKVLAPSELREEVLQLAKEMKSFEAVSDREFVKTLAGVPPLELSSEAERDEVLDQQSAELIEHDLRTWRAYRERFYQPARAFRDELRKRLGIRNVQREPRIPALDQAQLTGARPIAQAADYLAGLARRLK